MDAVCGPGVSGLEDASARNGTLEAVCLHSSVARLRENPHDLDALETAGALFLLRGEPTKALECFHRITRENPA